MSHSSDPDQPARRRTTVVVVLALLMAIAGGVLSITPTTGTVSAWADPPLELVVTAPDEAARPVATPSARRVGFEAAAERPVALTARFPRAATRPTTTTTAGDAPPPGRSPPRH